MNYHLHYQGQNLGVFPLEELRNRRNSGELTGQEFVWCQGMRDWKTLDSVLNPASRKKPDGLLIVGVAVGVLFFLLFFSGLGYLAVKGFNQGRRAAIRIPQGTGFESRKSAVATASAPIVSNSNTLTAASVLKKEKEFRERQYLESYRKFARHDSPADLDAQNLINSWIISNFGTDTEKKNVPLLTNWSDTLGSDPDPVVQLITALEVPELHDGIRRLQQAVDGFQDSKYPGYPKFYANMMLANKLIQNRAGRRRDLDAAAVLYLTQALKEGSVQPGDQDDIAETLVYGSGETFFERNGASVYQAVLSAGNSYRWLGLVLQGEFEINEAWKSRGDGYAGSVTQQGWNGFYDHLAKARSCLTEAWKLHPEFPLAPTRMMTVALGDSGLDEMRQWFDRAVMAQIDYQAAWKELRWGLRPRWYGSTDSMLAFGETALRTGRYDTYVPHMFLDTVSDLESELQLPPGEHVYGRADIWPNLQEMYEGYINRASEKQNNWRASYSSLAYIAGKYDVAKSQLDALGWKPNRVYLSGWGQDLSLMPLEVAARTGPLGSEIAKAEAARKYGDAARALQLYQTLSHNTNIDQSTAAFVRDRLKTLDIEQRLQSGEWVSMLPDDPAFTGWNIVRGDFHLMPDGSLEVNSAHEGHILYSRARIGKSFEVKGEIITVQSSTGAFQGGVVLGLPEPDYWTWDSFRLRRNKVRDQVTFAEGWSTAEVLYPASLNDVTNTFDLRFGMNRITASVNGTTVFQNVAPPENWHLTTNEMHFGLGAFNNMNVTTLRYRDVQVRVLPEE